MINKEYWQSWGEAPKSASITRKVRRLECRNRLEIFLRAYAYGIESRVDTVGAQYIYIG